MKFRWLVHALAFAATLAPACAGNGGGSEQTTPAKVEASQSIVDPIVELPNGDGSLKFAVLGDFGTGRPEQYALGEEMARFQKQFPFDIVVTVGDNLYGRQRASDFKKKFEEPYKALLDAGVKFYASLGNHDIREQPTYKLFNMSGELFYRFDASESVSFFVLDTSYATPEQVAWIEKELSESKAKWKIVAFHHPLYSSGGRHGSDLKLREKLEPLFVEHGVSVVLQGHDHFYERTTPQKGIVYFVAGSGGKLSPGDINRNSPFLAKGFDTALVFMAVEIHDDRMYFNAISDKGQVVDSGIIQRRMPVDEKAEKDGATSSGR